MFRVLIADDAHEDRELLRLEIGRALDSIETEIRFAEAVSVKKALELLKTQPFDLLTLDIEFDRMNEGLSVLPEIFENYPVLNILVISGKLSKTEVAEQLFRFTKDNVFKGKRWVRHFDVLDKKDEKTDTIRRVYSLALKRHDEAVSINELFAVAESYLEKEDAKKCLEVYKKIQNILPGETESSENIRIMKGAISAEHILEYFRKGEGIIASLLMGHYLEKHLKIYTRKLTGRAPAGLFDCLRELERAGRISSYKKTLFQKILNLRNKAVHSPTAATEKDFDEALSNLRILEAKF